MANREPAPLDQGPVHATGSAERRSPASAGPELAGAEDSLAAALLAFHKDPAAAPISPASFRFIPQTSEADCGAACLAMIAALYDRPFSIRDYHAMVPTSEDGASMLALLDAARRTGFLAMGIATCTQGLKRLRMPALLHFRRHYVVLFHIESTFADLMDPRRGHYRLSMGKLKQRWSGLAILLRPGW